MNQRGLYILDLITLFPNVCDFLNANMPTLKQANSLFIASTAVRICTLRFRMEFVIAHNVAIRFDARRLLAAMKTRRTDVVTLAGAVGDSLRVFQFRVTLPPIEQLLVNGSQKSYGVGAGAAAWFKRHCSATRKQ
jgi:hypothetical protein